MRHVYASLFKISIHTSPKGGDPVAGVFEAVITEFQSTPPRREVT